MWIRLYVNIISLVFVLFPSKYRPPLIDKDFSECCELSFMNDTPMRSYSFIYINRGFRRVQLVQKELNTSWMCAVICRLSGLINRRQALGYFMLTHQRRRILRIPFANTRSRNLLLTRISSICIFVIWACVIYMFFSYVKSSIWTVHFHTKMQFSFDYSDLLSANCILVTILFKL